MATSRRFEISELFPQPKEVILGEGISELAMDVRLSTSNVLPIQRKALRSILTMGGVRVVANKKKYVVDAQVLGPDAFDLSRIPSELRHDFYELEIKGSEVFIRTPYQAGTVWAAQTLSLLFNMMFKGRAVPNLVIRDWPVVPLRGMVMDADWGTERMSTAEWFQALDYMSAMHLNLCGIGVYDCRPDVRAYQTNRPCEFLMSAIHEEPLPGDPVSKSRLRYYNVKYDRWYDREVAPVLAENNEFADVLTYGRERGITIFPAMNLFGRSTLLPRLIPALSACNEKGKPTGYGLCLSSNAARGALEEFLGAFLEMHFPDGVEYFHLGFDDLSDIHPHAEDGAPESVWCQCAKCRKSTHAKLFAQFLQWIVGYLTGKGVGKVVLYSDQLLQGEKLLGADLEKLLKDATFASKIVIDWEDPGNELKTKLVKNTEKKFALTTAWLSPRANRGNYGCFTRNLEGVDAFVRKAMKDKAEGVVVRGQFDPAYLEQLAMLGVRCWETPEWKEDTIPALRTRWAELEWGAYSERYLSVLDRLDKLSGSPLNQEILLWNHLEVKAGAKKGALLSPYPAKALEKLAAKKDAAKQLSKLVNEAIAITEETASILADGKWNDLHTASLQSIIATAQRVRIQLGFFLTLLAAKDALARKSGGTAAATKILLGAAEDLVVNLKVIEENMPDGLMWITMQHLGCQKLFLERLVDEVKSKKSASKITWDFPFEWEVPED